MNDIPALHVTVSTVVPAPPDEVYAIIADLESIGSRSPEATGGRWLSGHGAVGDRFKGTNRIGAMRWSTVATVTQAEPGRRFAFETAAPSRSSWSYDLEAVDGGTLVVESMTKHSRQPLPIRLMQRLAGVSDRRADLELGMRTTLQRLREQLSTTTVQA